MELQEAIAAYRERITDVLSQSPAATDEWVRETTDHLMAPIETGNGDGNHLRRSLQQDELST